MTTEYDAIVIGAGPNGLAAAITLQQQGLSVLVIEGEKAIGGGMRTAELTLPGYLHDVCSTIYPLAADSPVFNKMPLDKFGLQFLYPTFAAAHPFTNGRAIVVEQSIENTARQFPRDSKKYSALFTSFVKNWPHLRSAFLAPLHFPAHLFTAAKFGLQAVTSAAFFARYHFSSEAAKALFAGMAAHSMLPLHALATSAFALTLMTTAHAKGWPVARGGAQSIANALGAYFTSLGGTIVTGHRVRSLADLPPARAILFDTSPHQLLQIAGHSLSSIYQWQLRRYRYGMGVFKMDWALSEPTPFTAPQCRDATTVHLGNSYAEIRRSEYEVSKGRATEEPFLIFAQPGIVDSTRMPAGKGNAWAYCHVPNGATKNMTDVIERQIERFAPGFKDCILARHQLNTEDLQLYNPNYIGGDINGGRQSISQLFTRPALRFSPYRTSAKGLYLCSSSTPPGGGVHGICGYYAARQALEDIFTIRLPRL